MNIEEIRKELEQTKEHLAKLEVEINKINTKCTEKWRPKYGEKYWAVGGLNKVWSYIWDNDNYDSYYYDIGNCFKTESEAKHRAELLETERQLMKFAREHNDEIDWEDEDQEKYYIYYNYCIHYTHNCDIGCMSYIKEPRLIYFSSKKIAQQAIDTIGADKIEAYLKEL